MDNASTLSLDVGRDRLRYLLKSMFALTTTIWRGRNERLHGDSISKANSANRLEDNEIRYYHTQPELLLTTDRHYCERPLDLILKSTPTNRRRWLRQVKPARHRRLTDRQTQSQLPQFYFRTARIPPPSRDPAILPSPAFVQPLRQTSLMSLFCPIVHRPLPRQSTGASTHVPASTVSSTTISTSRQALITSFLCPAPTQTLDHSPAPLPEPPPRRESSILSFFCSRTP